jgi:hypothetical protein
MMLVHDEAVSGIGKRGAGRLGRLGEVSLGSVGLQFGHGATLKHDPEKWEPVFGQDRALCRKMR